MIHNNMMKKIISFFKHYRWAFLTGLFVGTSYIPFPPWALLFCYTPLWLFVVSQAQSRKEAFFAGWVSQFVLSFIGFHWVAYVSHEFGYLPWPIAILALLLFCALIHLYIPIATALAWTIKDKLNLSISQSLFSLALLTSLFERIWPSIFPWNLGYPLLWAKIPIYHWADSIGFAGLSTLALLANAWISWLWSQRSDSAKILKHGLSLLLVLAALIVSGSQKAKFWQNTDAEINFLAIQANIGNLEKVYAEKGQGYQDDIIQTFVSMSNEGLKNHPETNIIIWPETAFPDYLDDYFLSGTHQTQLFKAFAQTQKTLLTGAYSKDQQTDSRDTNTYNALFLLSSQGFNFSPPYHKTHLLAFGEYLPLSEQFPILLQWLPFVANFGRGHGPEVLGYPMPQENMKVQIGGQICYEGLYPEFSRGLAKKGAHILANVTNDSWFGYYFEPNQHMIMTLARAIETRRPLIRSTNTGITTAILASGERLSESPTHEKWQGQFKIPFMKNPPQTFYVQYGHYDWIILLLVLFLILRKGLFNAFSRRT